MQPCTYYGGSHRYEVVSSFEGRTVEVCRCNKRRAGVSWAPTSTGALIDGFRIALDRMERIENPRFSDRLAIRSLEAVIAELTKEPSDG